MVNYLSIWRIMDDPDRKFLKNSPLAVCEIRKDGVRQQT
jgi:hypothetical protein